MNIQKAKWLIKAGYLNLEIDYFKDVLDEYANMTGNKVSEHKRLLFLKSSIEKRYLNYLERKNIAIKMIDLNKLDENKNAK